MNPRRIHARADRHRTGTIVAHLPRGEYLVVWDDAAGRQSIEAARDLCVLVTA